MSDWERCIKGSNNELKNFKFCRKLYFNKYRGKYRGINIGKSV